MLSCSPRRRLVASSVLAAAFLGVLAGGNAAAHASYVTTVQTSSPLSYYRLEETTGTTAVDSGSLSLNATYNGGFTLNQTGIPGGDATDRAVAFNGSNGFASVSGNYTSIGTYPLSLSAFVKSTQTTGTPEIAGLTNNSTTLTDQNLCINIQAGLAGIRVRNSTTDAKFTGSGVNVADGRFHQVVAVFESSTSRKLYVDGQLVGTDTTAATFPVLNTFGIGALARSSTADFLNGTVDEVSVYNTALSAATIQAQYQASGVPEPTSMGVLSAAGIGLLMRRRRR